MLLLGKMALWLDGWGNITVDGIMETCVEIRCYVRWNFLMEHHSQNYTVLSKPISALPSLALVHI